MKVIRILALIVLVTNVLSLDFDNLLDFKNNKTTIINIIVMILIVLTSFYKKIKNDL